jgi:hypothetical protein
MKLKTIKGGFYKKIWKLQAPDLNSWILTLKFNFFLKTGYNFNSGQKFKIQNSELKNSSYSFLLVFIKKFIQIRPTDQKINGNHQQTYNRQIFLSGPPSIWEILVNFFFEDGRERTNRVKFIPPCMLREFALLTCSTRRGIKAMRDFEILSALLK